VTAYPETRNPKRQAEGQDEKVAGKIQKKIAPSPEDKRRVTPGLGQPGDRRDRRFHRLLLAMIGARAAVPSTPKDQAAACCLADCSLRKAAPKSASCGGNRERRGGNSDA
jgi:hypothetical protein